MYFQQSDVFQGLDRDFMSEFMEITTRETHEPGHALYREGDPAERFYVLLKGCVKITIGETGHSVYTVDRPGEVFGWSGLVGREKYAASAECRETTMLLRIQVSKMEELLQENAASGLIFYKKLAGFLGKRLLQTYKLIPDTAEISISRSYGTGQVLQSDVREL